MLASECDGVLFIWSIKHLLHAQDWYWALFMLVVFPLDRSCIGIGIARLAVVAIIEVRSLSRPSTKVFVYTAFTCAWKRFYVICNSRWFLCDVGIFCYGPVLHAVCCVLSIVVVKFRIILNVALCSTLSTEQVSSREIIVLYFSQ